jgi:hypothetical protein
MADFSPVLQEMKFNNQYIFLGKNSFCLKKRIIDATLDIILLSKKDQNIDFVPSSSLFVFSWFNICRTINSSPNQEKKIVKFQLENKG